MSAGHTPATPETSFEFVAEWFAGAAKSAAAKGNRDSAQLWRDGLQHLMHLNAERDRLKAANAELFNVLNALIDVWDDSETHPDYRCYVEGAWKSILGDANAALAKHQKEQA